MTQSTLVSSVWAELCTDNRELKTKGKSEHDGRQWQIQDVSNLKKNFFGRFEPPPVQTQSCWRRCWGYWSTSPPSPQTLCGSLVSACAALSFPPALPVLQRGRSPEGADGDGQHPATLGACCGVDLRPRGDRVVTELHQGIRLCVCVRALRGGGGGRVLLGWRR